MGFGTCCGDTSRTAFAVRSGSPVTTCSIRVSSPCKSGAAGGVTGGVGAGVGAGAGGGVGAGGSVGGALAGTGFVSDISFQPFNGEEIRELRLDLISVFPPVWESATKPRITIAAYSSISNKRLIVDISTYRHNDKLINLYVNILTHC